MWFKTGAKIAAILFGGKQMEGCWVLDYHTDPLVLYALQGNRKPGEFPAGAAHGNKSIIDYETVNCRQPTS